MATNTTSNLPDTLTWKAPNQQAVARSSGWYLGFALVSLGLIAFAIYNKSITTMILFVLIIGLIYFLGLQSPREITVRIGKTGISLNQTLYPYKSIKFFWLIYNPPQIKTLNFETTAYINNKISVQLADQNPLTVKKILSQYLPEDLNREESVTEALARRLKI